MDLLLQPRHFLLDAVALLFLLHKTLFGKVLEVLIERGLSFWRQLDVREILHNLLLDDLIAMELALRALVVAPVAAVVIQMVFLYLAGQHRSAVAATHEAGERKAMLAASIGVVVMLGDDLLHVVIELLGDDCREVGVRRAGFGFHEPVIDRVLQHTLDVFLNEPLTTLAFEPSLDKRLPEVVVGVLAGRIELKRQLHVLRTHRI